MSVGINHLGFAVDDLAQAIRQVDGNNTLGAGALAEALMPFLITSPVDGVADGDNDRMIKIDDLVSQLQGIRRQFGNTCVYIRRGGMGWGAVALNRRDDDKKNGVFDLQAQHDHDMLARLQQIERLIAERNDLRATLNLAEGDNHG